MEKIIEQIKKPMKFVNEETGELEVNSSLRESFCFQFKDCFQLVKMSPELVVKILAECTDHF